MIVGWAINPVGLGAVGYGRVWSGTVGFSTATTVRSELVRKLDQVVPD